MNYTPEISRNQTSSKSSCQYLRQFLARQSVSPDSRSVRCFTPIYGVLDRVSGIWRRYCHVEPDFDDIFICPQSFNYLTTEEAKVTCPEQFVTKEDVPPKALGDRIRTITCAECNRWSGSQLDSHLKNKLLLDDFLNGVPGATVDAQITTDLIDIVHSKT